MSGKNTDKLSQYRQEIDAIDDELIALLKQRIGIVEKVGAFKKSSGETGLYIRSGREGAMLVRIYDAFKGGPFNAIAATAMWRQIISASIHLESPLSLSVLHDDTHSHLMWLAREHFGGFVPLQPVSNVNRIFGELGAQSANIGVLPYPDSTELSNWWQLMSQDSSLKIFATLPAVASDALPTNMAHGLAIAAITPEPSGNDQSYFSLVMNKTFSSSHLQKTFTDAGAQVTFLNATTQEPRRSMLIRLDGFHDDESQVVSQVKDTLGEALEMVHWLGAHATTISTK